MTAAPRPLVRTFLVFFLLAMLALASEARAAGPLGGRVTDPDGRPVAGALVEISGPGAPIRVVTGPDGRFLVAVIAPGAYQVVVSAAGLSADPRAVVVGEAAVSLDVALRLSAVAESLVVSAAQVDQPLSRTPDSVTVIDGRELAARQIFTLGSALRSVAGLSVTQSGGPGTVTSLFSRGGESDYTLVLVDGVRANGFGGGMDLSQVPLQDVERIESVRGPQSALYGSDAIGGVVQVITRRGGAPTADGQFEFGSRAMRRAAAGSAGEAGAFYWSGSADYYGDDGFTGLASNGETVSNDDAREWQTAGSLGWRHAGSGADVRGQFRYVDTDRGSPGPYGSDPAGRFAGVDTIARGATSRISGGARWLQPWFGASSRVRQRVEFDAADYDLAYASAWGGSTGETRRIHTRIQTDASVSPTLGLSGGLEWLGERGASSYIVSGTGEVPVDRGVLGLFAEARWTAGDRVSVTAGARGERIRRAALPGDPNAFLPRPDFAEDIVTSFNPKVAASWLVAGGAPDAGGRAWTRLRGAAGTGIRPPDAFEIAFTDNPGLKPERSESYEVGVTQAVAGGAVQIDATAFFNNYSDLIISVGHSFAGISRYRTDNVSNARARGLELTAAWSAGLGVRLRGAYTLLDTEILAVNGSSDAPSPYAVGDPLLRRPRHQGTLDANWAGGPATAFLQVVMRGRTLDADPAFGPTGGLFVNPGYGAINLGGSWKPLRQVELLARVLNLADRAYEEVLGYPAMGRTAYAGVRLAVGR